MHKQCNILIFSVSIYMHLYEKLRFVKPSYPEMYAEILSLPSLQNNILHRKSTRTLIVLHVEFLPKT